MEILLVLWLYILLRFVCNVFCLPEYNPGDTAPSFVIQTLDGRLVYKEKIPNDTTFSNPIIFSAFTNHSAFLQALWTEKDSITHLLERSPRNTQYVFISFADDAKNDVKRMRTMIFEKMDKVYSEKKLEKKADILKYEDEGVLESKVLFKRAANSGHSVNNSRNGGQELVLYGSEHSGESELVNWKKHFHFACFPLFTFGNWIPFVMAIWPCLGTGCGLAQVTFKNSKGDILHVVPRLDARYDWQPTPFKSLAKHENLHLHYVEDPCGSGLSKSEAGSKVVALVSSHHHCTTFNKIQKVAKSGAKYVLIYAKKGEPLREIKCQKEECYHLLGASASMISFEAGEKARMLLKKQKLFIEFQTTSQDNFFFAIDHRGRLAEVGLFLYPSLHFLAYEAQWFAYEADLARKASGHAKVITVFNHTLMQGEKGAVKKIHLPKDFLLYRNAELDMSLRCPDSFDMSCPHWDHVISLSVCCKKNHELCDEELGRWITPYARSIGRWLTPVTSLLPLFTSSTCTLTMNTVPWEMPWNPTLSIRLSDHISDSVDGYSKKRYSPDLVPYKVLKLFHGGTFDKNYNKKYTPKSFLPPAWTKKVKLVAIITGHGKDNNGCAEFCVTSHHFVINDVSENVKVFKNAATATGCAQRVEQGVEPNEHGTWLYGRDGWCPGQEVVPWTVDVTTQIHMNRNNTVKYFSYFQGADPNPKHSAGSINLSSYLVFYRPAADLLKHKRAA